MEQRIRRIVASFFMARNRLISFTYQFIFDRQSNVWNNLSDFQGDLSDFFGANGLECEIVVPIEGNGSTGLMWVKKIDEGSVGKLKNEKDVNKATQLPPGNAQKSSQLTKHLTGKMLKNLKSKGGRI